MKLAVTQSILGILVVAAAAYIAWWLLAGVTELLVDTVVDETGASVPNVTPENETLFTVSRGASVLSVVLGLVVAVTGVLGWKTGIHRKSALTQTVAGALLVLVSAFVFRWGYALDFIFMIEGGPVLTMGTARVVTVLTALLGLAITGVGISRSIQLRQ